MPDPAVQRRHRPDTTEPGAAVTDSVVRAPSATWIAVPDTALAHRPLRRSAAVDAYRDPGPVPVVLRRSAGDVPGLTVGRAGDPEEARADRVADAVLRTLSASQPSAEPTDADRGASPVGPNPAVRRAMSPADAPVVGREGGPIGPGLTGQINSRLGGGDPLPSELRTRMEGAFGRDLGGVRVHTDDAAATLSRQVAARAFTVGRDVFFGAGEYRPDTNDGQRTIAHELAHTGEGVRRMHRLWDMREGKPVGVAQTTEMTTVGNRQVWFLSDGEDKVVVKLEDQPLGLNQLATVMHSKVTKATTVKMKKLPAAERAAVRQMIQDGRRTAGDGWAKAESGTIQKADYGNDLTAWGRAVHVSAIDASPNVPMVAMTLAEGKTVDALQDPALAHGGTGIAPIKKILTEAPMVRQLGELSAVDLFLGNTDRVLSGNLGNWFYTPAREMTVIDNVNADMARGMNLSMPEDKEAGAPTKRRGVRSPTARDPLDMLATSQLKHTAYDLAQGISNTVRGNFTDNTEKFGWDDWFGLRRASIESHLLDGLMAGRKRLIKTLLSSRTNNIKLRSTKKKIKAQARASAAEDAPQDDYYDILKARAKWLARN
jgi:hypothetical protein